MAEQGRIAAKLAADLAKYQADSARYQADLEAWRTNPQPGQPMPLMPMHPVPAFSQTMLPMPPMGTPLPFFFPYPLLALLGLPAALAAEKERVRKLQQEEDQQTPYTVEDLMENWEFKIVRCAIPLFDQPAFLERILCEEARAGWQLVEKFDGMRVRLKRNPRRPHAADLPAGYDPYRTAVGPTAKFHVLLWIGCIVSLVVLLAFIVAQIYDPIAPFAAVALIAAAASGAIVSGLFAIRQTAKYHKLVNAG